MLLVFHHINVHQLLLVAGYVLVDNVTVDPLVAVRLLTLCQFVYVADVALDDVLHHVNVYHALVNVLVRSVQLVSYVHVVLLILPAHQLLLYAM